MSNIQEPNTRESVTEPEMIDERFAPQWSECSGIFNDGNGLSSRENEELHYRKHATIGREWGCDLSLSEYRVRATEHLNSLDANSVVELCQIDDLAVVKYNIDTGDLGIARSNDGAIKTYFRPNDIQYVVRKVKNGAWAEPAAADGFEQIPDTLLKDDPESVYLFSRLEELAMELPSQAHEIVLAFTDGQVRPERVISLLAHLGEYRFCVFELQRRVLTEAQNDRMFSLRKQIVLATASFEALERYRSRELTEFVAAGVEDKLEVLHSLWREAQAVIRDVDEFEAALDERQLIGYAMLELKILHLHQRLLNLDVKAYENRLIKSDIYLRSIIYVLAIRFQYREEQPVAPEGFFWRRIAANIS